MARSYNQDCVLAYALDILGERWSLLIVRELFLGPRRFADLISALPGIGTNLLSKRLKELETLGLIQAESGMSARGQYRLADAGENLRDSIRAIMRWSIEYFLSRPEPSEVRACIYSNNLNPDCVALATELYASKIAPRDLEYVAHLYIDEMPYTLYYMNNDLIVRRGSDVPAVARIDIDVETAMQTFRGEIAPSELMNRISVDGREDCIRHIIDCVTLEGKKYADHQSQRQSA